MVDIHKGQHKKVITMIVVLALITAGLSAWWYIESKRDDILVLATTTSTYDSGLLDEIIPDFEEDYGVRVKTIAVGTGQALELGRNGDADVLLVHAPEREEEFVEEGYGKYRYEVMYNEFVLVGPEDDPAGIRGSQDVTETFNRLYENRGSITFCSRGDDSGTHIKEIKLWEDAGFDHDEIDSQAHSHW
ncbi:MAG: substrate-binding domain-containing protein, partial [Thermoplasmatota archaeon]